jgi:hypothetical protein
MKRHILTLNGKHEYMWFWREIMQVDVGLAQNYAMTGTLSGS